MGESQDGDAYDAIVVSGDVTQAGAQEGFDAFGDFLDLLGDTRPATDRILVVPGNHDVSWETPSSSQERYERFLGATREKGYVTPLIDGIDFEANELSGHENERLKRYPHIVEHDDFLIVGLNSSNWCGVLADYDPGSIEQPMLDSEAWTQLLDEIADPNQRKRAERSLTSLRLHDVPRVSWAQLNALSRLLHDLMLDKGDGRLRVAVLHHHLLPVSGEEELKTFESITDLAAVRRFLRTFGFHVVLHGHKHRGAVYVDAGSLPESRLGDSRQIFVVAAPADSKPTEELFRVLEVGGTRGGHWLLAHTYPALEPGGPDPIPSTQEIPVWTAEQGPRRDINVRGETRDDVYARVQALFHSPETPHFVSNLLCVIDNSQGADSRPASYQSIEHPSPDKWFTDVVAWWQRPRSRLLSFREFNHGERISDRYGDQLERAARALEDDVETSRACVVLVDPAREAGSINRNFPAFVAAQLKLAEVSSGHRRLDVIGIFRKQEMMYWWAINVAELASMQKAVFDELSRAGRLKVGVSFGTISTFSVMAYVGTDIPEVDVAGLDLALDDPGKLTRMATAVVTGAADEAAAADWNLAFDEMSRLRGGRLVIPRRGWAELVALLEAVEGLAPDKVGPVLIRLRELSDVVELAGSSSKPEQFGVRGLAVAVEAAREAVSAVLNPAQNPHS
jgi:predicted phosphodiesterase